MLNRIGFTTVWVLSFTFMLVWLGLLIVRVSAEIDVYRDELRDDRSWHVAQMQLEMERLRGILALYLEAPSSEHRQRASVSAEILWSRAAVITQGETGEFTRNYDLQLFGDADRILDYLRANERLIVAMPIEYAQRLLPVLDEWIEAFLYRTTRVTQSDMFAAEARGKRVQESYQQIQTVLVLLGTLGAGLLAILLWTFNRNNKLRLAAEKANRVQAQFLANMSHEIRTPLNGIVGTIELLREPHSELERGSLIKTLEQSSSALLSQINDVLDFSRLDSGHMHLDNQPFDLIDLIKSSTQVFYAQARAKGIDLNVVSPSHESAWVLADDAKIRQILLNLVGNAIKFTTRGSVDVTLNLTDDREQSHLCLRVRDTGIGISQAKQAMLFTPFHQADASTNRHYGGTGLGLAISQQLAQLMGGVIEVDSQFGHGSEFRVLLSLARISQPNVLEQLGKNPEQSTFRLKGSVLVAEDNLVNQTIARKLLEKTGLAATVVNDGRQVLERCAAQHFDLILMDVQMPGIDGLDATRRLKKQGNTTPVIALTANATPESRQACLDAGMSDFITKPFKFYELRQVLRLYLPVVSDDQDADETRS